MHARLIACGLSFTVLFGILTQRGLTAQTTGVREVEASPRSVTPLQTRLRYTTMIVLPEDEEILDVICGDKDFWVISATHNIVHVKPAKEGAATNLNLVTAGGDPSKPGHSLPDPGITRHRP